ncbi:regulatory helix-turn-helix protein, lysR family [Pseudomonas sp. NFPP33]|jgi:DNA-binding transcriptional LysR family regulator|nr:LysR family transcriptional regulator [Pseudomonas sp. NFPP33]SDA85813.1 regulatory helix-turn-helix protein, lysR family [Pseudomonas sp. NFPP33]
MTIREEILAAIDLNLLVVFICIHKKQSISLAAKSLGVTQPAVSNSLAKLRQKFNDPLFTRSGKGVVATPKAERIASKLCPAMKLIADAITHNFR